MISMVINIRRIALLRITFSPSELSRPPIEPAVIFFLHWARENQQGDKGAEPGKGIHVLRGFYRVLRPIRAIAM
jgi:hypothetical protein